jgi:pSer/pThr/pTyr-binding forkhead associated (FHA) protein
MPRIQISEPGKTPQPYKVKLDREIINIGRAGNNDLILTDPSTSSKHCFIKRVQGGYILEDNKSTNGIKLDGHRFIKIDLNQDTQFKMGDVDVDFTLSEEEYEILAKEDKFKSEQKLMLPPTTEERQEKRAKREAAKPAAKNPDSEIQEDESDSPASSSSKPCRKRHSSSRASRMLEVAKEDKNVKDNSDIEVEEDDDDEDEDEENEREKNNKRSSSSRPPRRAQRLAEINKTKPLTAAIFAFLCVIGFLAGLSFKHYQEYKTFLLKDVFGEKPLLPEKKGDSPPPPTE